MPQRTTEEIILHGKTKFCRPFVADKFGKYSTLLYLSPTSVEKFRSLGVKTVLKKDDDGYYTRISCPVQKLMKGVVVGMKPIEVIDSEGKPFNDPIGDGSDVAVKCDYYGYTAPTGEKGKAIRWTGIKIKDLVPFVSRPEAFTEEEKKAQGSLPSVVEEEKWK